MQDTVPARYSVSRSDDAHLSSSDTERHPTPGDSAPPQSADPLLAIGSLIDGKYEVRRQLGSGGMGAVYEGFHRLIERKVAIKVLHPHVSGDSDIINRFLNEARITAELGCENIVEVSDMGVTPTGAPYLVMEYLEGETLGDRIHARGALPIPEAAEIIIAILRGLAEVHKAGVVHRDLKPDNVFLSDRKYDDGTTKLVVKLLDFGISKMARPGTDGLHLTQTGAVIGTPWYMSPEQARGGKGVDHRTDIYATGLLLFEALIGSRPFAADNYNELMYVISNEDPPLPSRSRPDLPEGLEEVVLKALARDPDRRFRSASEFLSALAPYAPDSIWADSGEFRSSSASDFTGISPQKGGYVGRDSISTYPDQPQRGRGAWMLVGVGVVLAVSSSIAVGILMRDETGPTANPAAVVSAVADAGPADAASQLDEAEAEVAPPGDGDVEPDRRTPTIDGDVDTETDTADQPPEREIERSGGRRPPGKGTSRPGLTRDIPF